VSASGHEQVGRFDVAVNDAGGMCSVQRVSNRNRLRQENAHFQWATRNVMLQRLAIQEFHDDERLPVLLADVMDGADAGMVQRGRRLSLALEAGQSLRVPSYLWRQKLERHKTVKTGVLCFVNHTHATAAEFLNDAVVGDRLANHRIGQY